MELPPYPPYMVRYLKTSVLRGEKPRATTKRVMKRLTGAAMPIPLTPSKPDASGCIAHCGCPVVGSTFSLGLCELTALPEGARMTHGGTSDSGVFGTNTGAAIPSAALAGDASGRALLLA